MTCYTCQTPLLLEVSTYIPIQAQQMLSGDASLQLILQIVISRNIS